jgi:hypothetical protein
MATDGKVSSIITGLNKDERHKISKISGEIY